MKIVTTFHNSSSVLCSLKCRLASRDIEHLIVAKLNRIDVYSLQPQGLRHECTTEIRGKVLCIRAIPISGSGRSKLVLMIAHPDPELIFFSFKLPVEETAELVADKQLSLYERTPRPAEFFNNIIVHPSGKLAVVSCYTGKLKIVTFKAGSYEQDFDVSLPELNVFSVAFLPTSEDEYAIAILHIDHQERIQLLARDISIDDLELSPHPSALLHQTPISSKNLPYPTEFIPQLVTVPTVLPEDDADADEEGFPGGVLVVGGKKILFYELTPREAQEKQRGKRRRLEKKKKNEDVSVAAKAKEKEREREGRRRKPKATVEWPWTEVTAWCAIDEEPLRFFLGDSYGRLSLLSLDNLKYIGLVLLPLGETSAPTTLTYLTNQTLYIGSHMGDSQLVQVSPSPLSYIDSPTLPIPLDINTVTPNALTMPGGTKKGKGKAIANDDMDVDEDTTNDVSVGCVVNSTGSYINVVESYKNIAPIMDAVLADTDGSGQSQIVTCSGGHNTGSVNVVRNGADFQELASVLGVPDVVRIWSMRLMHNDKFDTHIIASTLTSTHLFKINDSGSSTTLTYVKDKTSDAFITDKPTLAFANVFGRNINIDSGYVDSSMVVQATPAGLYLLEGNSDTGEYELIASWDAVANTPPGQRQYEVVAASVNSSQIAVALARGELLIFKLTEKKEFELVIKHPTNAREISAVSITPLNPTAPYSSYVTLAYWSSKVIEIFILKPHSRTRDLILESLGKSEPLPALIRSLLLFNFGLEHKSNELNYHPYLIAGLSDGSIATYSWKLKELKKEGELKDRKIVSLGHAPVTLTPCIVEGKPAVFAAGNRASILSWKKERLIHSPIMIKDVCAAFPLNTPTFSTSLVLATSSGLTIGRVRELDKMHVRSIPFGLDNPRKIAYEPTLKVFIVACTRTEPGRIGDIESVTSSFRLLDDSTFAQLAKFNCEPDEEITSLTTFPLPTEGNATPLFCVGTYFYKADDKEPASGRILIFTAHETPGQSPTLQLSLVASQYVKGCVYAIVTVKNKIIAAVNSSVMIFRIDSSQDGSAPSITLKALPEWNHNYLVTSLASHGDHVVAGDQISSVSLLKVEESRIKSVARDYGPLWPVCVEVSDAEHIITANDALNLFTFSLNLNLGRSVLERDGSYHVADLITKFIRGALSVSDTPTLTPTQIFFTSSGRIGVIVDVVDATLSLGLTAVQRNLASTIPGIGGTSHTRYRAPKNTRGRSDADAVAFGFIDGDFLEQFLTLLGSPPQLQKVIEGQSEPERLTMSVEEIQKVLENLQSLH
ncbi:CPSF A subunit region-domain-containing protein [Crucibulum laeve]|uniref:CPSF A subunit region-domain-containing protein n=1 Tax=Crucibulum laeve TaxID=68775 RepID=A0A5C3MHQ0_9AGAR|nr:CPSF A subunit region-domain-containing protein [Crucibulum laeve]